MSLVAIVVVRDGTVPAGADEAVAEADGNVVCIGTGTAFGMESLPSARTAIAVETSTSRPRDLADIVSTIDAVVDAIGIILPASPDGRDLAPLVAYGLQRPLHAAAIQIREGSVTTVRTAGRVGREVITTGPFVATLVPGIRGVSRLATGSANVTQIQPVGNADATLRANPSVRSVEVLPPDPATMDLTEASCIVAGGLGLGTKDRFDQLARIGTIIGASLGGTRVASDAGWIPFERQIGTTGVAVKPSIYLCFGISGATQHTSGLGDPEHIVSVNTDPSCPMMTMADVAIVSDATAVLDALEHRLREHGESPR